MTKSIQNRYRYVKFIHIFIIITLESRSYKNKLSGIQLKSQRYKIMYYVSKNITVTAQYRNELHQRIASRQQLFHPTNQHNYILTLKCFAINNLSIKCLFSHDVEHLTI